MISRLALLAIPVGFVAAFVTLYVWLLIPRAAEGHPLAVVLALVAGSALISSVAAAITFSVDVLRGSPVEDD